MGGGRPLGIATQRSTVLFWDRSSGRPLTPAYSWQDLRGEALCARLASAGARSSGRERPDDPYGFAARTGLRLSPHYSAPKLAWAVQHVRGLRRRVARGQALWGTLGCFLLWRLTGGAWYGIDHANAQRTLLFNLRDFCWDSELFVRFGLEALLDAPALPALVPTRFAVGPDIEVAGRRLCPRAMTGDQPAAMIGLRLRRVGDVAINYGSGAFVLRNVGTEPRRVPGLLTSLISSWRPSGKALPRTGYVARYAVEGPVNAAATAIEWARQRLGVRARTAELDEFLGRDDSRPRTVHFLPAVAGVGAPRWDASARPLFVGDPSRHEPRELMRAVVESIAMRCAEILRASAATRRPPRGEPDPILVAGGLTRCRTLLQAQADLLQRPLITLTSPEASGIGVALLASDPALRSGTGRDRRGTGGRRARPGERVVRPRISRDAAERRYRRWVKAVYG